MNINDLYFGIALYSLSYSSKEGQKLETCNLFDFARIKESVALWVISPEIRATHDLLSWCFGDVHWRAEFEYEIAPLFGEPEKVDVYTLYVIPNRKLLEDMVNSVSVLSAEKYLKERRKERRRGNRK